LIKHLQDFNQNKASTSQVSVETCDDQIAQENDHLKREVKNIEHEVNKLKKQAKVRLPQDTVAMW
jgi:cell division protein FtsB